MPKYDPTDLPDDHDFDDDGNIVDGDGHVVADADGNEIRDELKDLRKAANRSTKHKAEAEAEKARADAAERKLGIVSAIGALDTPLKQMFADSYKGESTPEAITAAFAELTGTPAPAGEGETGPSAEEVAQQAERDALSTGAGSPSGEQHQRPAKTVALETAQAALDQGLSREEALGGYIHALGEAAHKGDPSVLVQEAQPV